MKMLHRIVRMAVMVVFLWSGLALVVVASTGANWQAFVANVAGGRLTALLAGVLCLCCGVLFGLTGMRVGSRERFLALTGESGTVSIRTTAIAEYLSKLATEFPSILHMRPYVLPGRGSAAIRLELRLRAGAQIHELCELLQQRVRESLAKGLGITEIRGVEVSVREIVSEEDSN